MDCVYIFRCVSVSVYAKSNTEYFVEKRGHVCGQFSFPLYHWFAVTQRSNICIRHLQIISTCIHEKEIRFSQDKLFSMQDYKPVASLCTRERNRVKVHERTFSIKMFQHKLASWSM
jgi:hypothetical protein